MRGRYPEKRCLDCGCRFFGAKDHCQLCVIRRTPVFECERCGFETVEELTLRDGELQCNRCLKREPDPTETEIYRLAAEIRAERSENWQMDEYTSESS